LWRTILRVDFYHLTRTPAEGVLPALAERLLSSGERLLVVSDDADQLDRVDRSLWDYKADSFLPHAKAGGAQDEADQPILLSAATEAANAARNIAMTDGLWRDAALGFERAFYLFNPDGIDAARAAWRQLGTAEGVERHFWKQEEDGKWREGP
jgi:DNA polymerase III subunit chi